MPLIPKGRAMALHLTPEYEEGVNSDSDVNPYDYFDNYEKCYAWCIGHQNEKRRKQHELD